MSYWTRAKNRLRLIARRWLPRNTHYGPTTVAASTGAYAQAHPNGGIQYIPLYVCKSRVEVRPDLFYQISPYFSYDTIDKLGQMPALTAEYAYGVAIINNGRLYTDNLNTIGIISENGTLMGDVSYQYSPSHSVAPENNEAMRMKSWPEVEYIKGTVLSLLAGGGSTNNYGHWLIDAMPRLEFIRQAGLEKEIDFYLVPSTRVDYQRDSIAMLGIPKEKLLVSRPGLHLKADRLIATAHPRGNRNYVLPDWVIDWNRHMFLQTCLEACKGLQFSEKVYITRRDSKIRNVVNEAQVIAHLAQKGFKDYTLAELPFVQKVALFAQAKTIICVSGAGLNNLMYSTPGCGVIDIFPPGMVHSQYYQFARYIGMPYAFIVAESDAPKSHEMQAGRNEDVYIAPQDLDLALAELENQALVFAH